MNLLFSLIIFRCSEFWPVPIQDCFRQYVWCIWRKLVEGKEMGQSQRLFSLHKRQSAYKCGYIHAATSSEQYHTWDRNLCICIYYIPFMPVVVLSVGS
jgi:hypothetical protein